MSYSLKDIILRCDTKNISKEIKKTKAYKTWYDMHFRCYSSKLHERYPTYVGCEVCEEWQDFNNFYKWYQQNYYEVVIDGEKCKMDLDKDIIIKGNKLYSPGTCIFVPHKINYLFSYGRRDNKLPIGIYYDSERNKFRAELGGKKLGRFKTISKAFAVYKKAKEEKIKEMARKYKPYIPEKLYDAMVHWKVEISD